MIASVVNCPICRKVAMRLGKRRLISNETSLQILFHVSYEAPGGMVGWPEYRFHMWVRCRPLSELLRVEHAGSDCQREHGTAPGPIAYRESAERLGFCPYHRWAGDPRLSTTAAMISDLQATGVFQSVGLFDGHSAPECIMTGTIEHLEEVDRGKGVSIDVRVSAGQWQGSWPKRLSRITGQ
jgi:hypothetical protein